jgi:hypothetical protein
MVHHVLSAEVVERIDVTSRDDLVEPSDEFLVLLGRHPDHLIS